MRVIDSSGVLDETTEEGRIFHNGIVLGNKDFFQGITISKISSVLGFTRCLCSFYVKARVRYLSFSRDIVSE